MIMFTPKQYDSIEEMRKASLYDCHSDLSVEIDGNWFEVFGYVGNVVYEADTELDEDDCTTWRVPGGAMGIMIDNTFSPY